MRAAPAVRVTVRPSPAANRLAMLLTATAAGLLAWWGSGWLEWSSLPSAALTGAAALGSLAAAWMALPRHPVTLTWDGRQWAWQSSLDAIEGDIRAVMDLGPWLLLRFRPAFAPRRPRWIALERAGLEAHWHALRCAVYSPRPAAETGAAAAASAASDTHDRP
jgi:hypothetical protein